MTWQSSRKMFPFTVCVLVQPEMGNRDSSVTPGRQTVCRIECCFLFACSRLHREGLIALAPIPKGMGKMGGTSLAAARPSVLAPGSALGSVPTVALSSAQVALHDTAGHSHKQSFSGPAEANATHRDPGRLPGGMRMRESSLYLAGRRNSALLRSQWPPSRGHARRRRG